MAAGLKGLVIGRVDTSDMTPTVDSPTEAPAKPAEPRFTFKDASGTETDISFSQSPFGMVYPTGKFPIRISKVAAGGHAESLGVKVGMIVTGINGAAIPEEFADADAAIKASAKKLKARIETQLEEAGMETQLEEEIEVPPVGRDDWTAVPPQHPPPNREVAMPPIGDCRRWVGSSFEIAVPCSPTAEDRRWIGTSFIAETAEIAVDGDDWTAVPPPHSPPGAQRVVPPPDWPPASTDPEEVEYLDKISSLEGELFRLQQQNVGLQKQLTETIESGAPNMETTSSDSKSVEEIVEIPGKCASPDPPDIGERDLSRCSAESSQFAVLEVDPTRNSAATVNTLSSEVTTSRNNDVHDSDAHGRGQGDFASEGSFDFTLSMNHTKTHQLGMSRTSLIANSAWGMHIGMQAGLYLVAVGGVLFVLVARGTGLGKDMAEDVSGLSAAGRKSPPILLEMIAYCLTGAGLISFFVNILHQPLILGYLLGGVLVGPQCLDIVHSVSDIQDFSSLGLVFLLFMVGLELNVKQLLQMGKVVLITGFMQFPVCVGLHLVAFMGLQAMGIDFGEGEKSLLYCALVCGISSTMIVAKLLGNMADMDSACGRLTVGILIFQDIWAITVLAIQPDLGNPQVTKLIKTFALIALLVVVCLAYAKYIMPVVFHGASENVELMLVISLCWCFFICCFAILPFIGLSMELAALISGVALATYPYSAEFNGKIKYIRDFFITIFFCGLGMQIPVPTIEPIFTAISIAIVVLVVRWIGIFLLVMILGGGSKLAVVATINLSEISEFALVICSLGVSYEHIEKDTLTIIIWVFAMLAIMSANMLPYNYKIYGRLVRMAGRYRGGNVTEEDGSSGTDNHAEDGCIVILGFHKIAAMLTQSIKADAPEIIRKLHVVDYSEKTLEKLQSKGISTAYGDISCADVLEHAVHGEARLVILSVPDYLLRGTTTEKLLKVARQVWPECKVIANADNPVDTENLYKVGADYVIRSSNICADKLASLLREFTKNKEEHALFSTSRAKDVRVARKKSSFILLR